MENTNSSPSASPKKKSSWHAQALGMLIGGVCGYAALHYGKSFLPDYVRAHDWTLIQVLLVAAGAGMMFFVTIVVHELGHLVAALANGFQFRVLTIGPWSMIYANGRVQFRFSKSVMAVLGGQQISAPPANGASDRQFIIYLLGGGIANIVTGVAAVAAIHSFTLAPWLAVLLLAFAFWSLFLGALNLFPMRAGVVDTDGKQIKTILSGGAGAARFRAFFVVIADIYSGVRPRLWKRETLDAMGDAVGTHYEKVVVELMRMQYALDCDAPQDALASVRIVAGLYDEVPTAMRPQVAAELAYFYALHRDPELSAEENITRSRRYANDISNDGYLMSPATAHRGRAAALMAESRWQEARVEIATGLAKTDNATNELDRLLEPEWLRAMLQRIPNAA